MARQMKETKQMKKLMIMAAIGCAAAVSHGAIAQWGMQSDSVAGPVGSASTDTDGYLIAGTLFLYVGDYVTATDSAFNFGSADYVDKSGPNGYFWGYPKTQVEVSDLASTAEGQKFSLILVDQVIDYTDLAKYEGNYVIYSGLSGEGAIPDPQGGPSTKYGVFLDEKSTYAGQWKTMAAPEPTSGILLLLGVAGLALKRKRA